MSTSVETALNTEAADVSNPFLQFVDPRRYRELVDLVSKRAEPGRLVCPLSHRGPQSVSGNK